MIERSDTFSSDIENPDEFFETYGLRIHQALRRIMRSVAVNSHKLYKQYNITSPQLICLYCLYKGGKMTQSKLSEQVSMSSSTLNGIIDRLEKKNLIIKERDTNDRRKVYMWVTQAGKELTKSAPLLLEEKFSKSLRALPQLEQAVIAHSLERVVELMRNPGSDAAGKINNPGQARTLEDIF